MIRMQIGWHALNSMESKTIESNYYLSFDFNWLSQLLSIVVNNNGMCSLAMKLEHCLVGGHSNALNFNHQEKIWKTVICWQVPCLRRYSEQWLKLKVSILSKHWPDSNGWATNLMNWSMRAKRFFLPLKKLLDSCFHQLYLIRMVWAPHAIWPA